MAKNTESASPLDCPRIGDALGRASSPVLQPHPVSRSRYALGKRRHRVRLGPASVHDEGNVRGAWPGEGSLIEPHDRDSEHERLLHALAGRRRVPDGLLDQLRCGRNALSATQEAGMSRRLIIAVLILVVGLPLLAQNGPDNDPDAAQGFVNNVFHRSNVDSINLYNGQLTVPIAVGPSYPIGPKLKFQAMLTYTSRAWEYGHPYVQAGYPAPPIRSSRCLEIQRWESVGTSIWGRSSPAALGKGGGAT